MNNDYEQVLRQYNLPPGVLSPEELRMLQHGGIQLDDSDGEGDDYYPPQDRITQPRLPRMKPAFENQSLKQIYQEQLSMKQKQLAYLQTQLNHRDRLMEAQRHRLESQHQLQMEKVLAELRNARAQVVKTQGQIPLIKEAIYRVKEMSTGMVSESVYLRLKDLPQRQLPPSEWIMVQVWEMIFPYKKDLEYHKRQVGKLRQEIKILNDKQHSLLNELEHYSRLLSSKDDDQKRHVLNYQNNRKCMELEIDKLRQEVQLLREKGARYDQLLRDYQFTKQEKELIEQKMGFYDKQAAKNTTGGVKISQQEAQRRKLQLLTQDKEYLTKQNIQLIQKNRRLEDRLDRLQAQLLSEKNRSQEYLQQLLNLKTDSVSTYEQKIYRQISQLKEKHHHQLQMSKNNLVDIYQKQLRFLKEAIEEKQLKLQINERNLRQKTKEYEQLMIDTRDFQRKFDGDLSQTRIQLKIRTQQLERVNNIYHETLANLNAHKLQNQMLREKLNIVKGQYYKSEANAKQDMSSLKAQVAVLRQQLANYEIIEKEIDQAVVSLGKLNPNDNSIYTHTLNSIPTSNKRRIQQALGLAQRLQAKQREHEQTQQLLRRRQDQLEKANNELKVARSLLQKTNQPYSYLVSNIQQKEKEIIMLRTENKKIDQSYENIKQEYRQLKRQLQQAEKDVERLLIKRQSIQNIQNILIELTRGPTTATQINSAVQQIKDILGTTSFKKTGPLYSKNNASQELKPTSEPPSWYKKLIEKKK